MRQLIAPVPEIAALGGYKFWRIGTTEKLLHVLLLSVIVRVKSANIEVVTAVDCENTVIVSPCKVPGFPGKDHR